MNTFIIEMWQLLLNKELQGIWFWAGVYAFCLCAYSSVYQLRIRSWPDTAGKLIKGDVEKFAVAEWARSEQNYIAKVLYSYEVEGKTLLGQRISPWIFVTSQNVTLLLKKQLAGVRQLHDGRINVFYNPKKPHKSYLLVPSKASILLTLVSGGIPLFLFYINFYR